MSSIAETAVLVALKYFETGQIYSWANHASKSADAFRRCIRALSYAKRHGGITGLDDIENIAQVMIGQVDNPEALLLEDHLFSGLLACSLLSVSDNSAELRAILNIQSEVLLSIARRKAHQMERHHIITERIWQWIDIIEQPPMTVNYNLTFSDGSLIGKITFHVYPETEELPFFLKTLVDRLAQTFPIGEPGT